MIEKFAENGSTLMIDAQIPYDGRNSNFSIIKEIIKLPFYLTIPLKSNFIFQKKRFSGIVVFFCLFLALMSFYKITPYGLIAISSGAIIYYILILVFNQQIPSQISELIALLGCVVWAFNFQRIIGDAIWFVFEAIRIPNRFTSSLIIPMIDYTLRFFISGYCYTFGILTKRTSLIRSSGNSSLVFNLQHFLARHEKFKCRQY